MSAPTITMPGLQTGSPETLLAYANAAYGLYQTLKCLNPKETDAPPSSPDREAHLASLAADMLTVGARVLDFENAISKHDVRLAGLERRVAQLNDRLDRYTGAQPPSQGQSQSCTHSWFEAQVIVPATVPGGPGYVVGGYDCCDTCGEVRKRR